MTDCGSDRMPAQIPALLAEIAELCDRQAAMRLLAEFGGQRIYIPKNPGARSPLVGAVGAAFAQKIAAHYGGDYIEVPSANPARARARRIARAVAESNASANDLAREHKVTRRWVNKLRARFGADDDQPGLFDPDLSDCDRDDDPDGGTGSP